MKIRTDTHEFVPLKRHEHVMKHATRNGPHLHAYATNIDNCLANGLVISRERKQQ